jgi:hydroxymethylglutaryl-CoA synthase
MNSVGLDAVAFHVPKLALDLGGEWAEARYQALGEASLESLVSKITKGIGSRRIGIPDAHEDTATMAAMAAKRLIDRTGIDPRDIGWLGVGTETTVDQSKSSGAYVLGMLERHYGVSMSHVSCPQFQFACIGATLALESALNLMWAGRSRRPYALVIASDVSKYAMFSHAEYTQGAGAAAMLLSRKPKLLAFDARPFATHTRDERDFFRPNWRTEAIVDGKHSINVYLRCVKRAFAEYVGDWERQTGKVFDERSGFDYLLMHLPFPRMGEYAAARLWRLLRDRTLLDAATEDDGRERELDRVASQDPLFAQFFERACEDGLAFSRETGNAYSASLYLGLCSLLSRVGRGEDAAGKRVLFCSYGSGASASVFGAEFVDGCEQHASLVDRLESLAPAQAGGSRQLVTLDQYERLHRSRPITLDANAQAARDPRAHGHAALEPRPTQPEESVRPPSGEFALTRIGTRAEGPGCDLGYRYYEYVAC